MRATALLFKPGALEPETIELTARAELEWYQGKLGGWIEQVPRFDSIRVGEVVQRCVAFCDEEGKLKGLGYNRAATIAWHDAIPEGLIGPSGQIEDILVGPVLVIAGDAEFMEEL